MKSLSLTQPHAIVMIGLPGSGKTFFAEKFSETFNAPYVSVALIAETGNISRAAAASIVDVQLDQLLKTKSTLVIEANSDTRTERMALSKKLRNAGYQILYVWVQVDPTTARQRFVKANVDAQHEHDQRVQRFSAPHASENPVVISGKHTYATQARVVLKKLTAPRANISKHSTPPVRTLSDIRRER